LPVDTPIGFFFLPEPLREPVPIPDAFIGLGMECLTPFEMLRNERERFVPGTSP